MTTDLIVGRPGASATPVKLESDIVDKETHSTQTMATSTMTTGRTVSRLHASTPITPTKQMLGQNVGSSNTGSFISTSITPVKPTSETWTWNLVVVAACLGGVILLGLALLFTKRKTDIVERESSAPFTKSVFPMTTDLIVGRPGASATPVKLESDIVDKETHSTQTMATSAMTTGQNVGSSNTGSFISTSITPVKPTSVGQTPHKSSTKASLLHVTPIDPPTAETWTWNLVVVAACLGGLILLGLALLFTKRRTERCSSKRTQADATDDLMCMRELNHGGSLPAGNDEAYSVITSVPAADCPTGLDKSKMQESQNEDSDIYHVYSTISEEPPPSALKDMVYSTHVTYDLGRKIDVSAMNEHILSWMASYLSERDQQVGKGVTSLSLCPSLAECHKAVS
ncbi:uncharacterized protein LOC115007691 [Cottoperca gobio]|uniref:Uncharacterized protein LOC115007691 n=1 Tax=Cottoperca gobio TaxID=56716 RepID=A0A6J2PMH5_COTGO|nr:uncharacterized protein LOC115007691 [Cottoperca gobio]